MGDTYLPLYPLIQTKLHRPPLPVDLVRRPRLTAWLEQRRGCPLTLVSAPAGYGKSTLISCWLESVDRPTTWLSLDERDNELGVFLGYFLAAIQTIFPTALSETQSLLAATQLPPVPAIAKILINELDQIEQPYTLVLDDYHLIETPAIHDLSYCFTPPAICNWCWVPAWIRYYPWSLCEPIVR